MSVGKPTIFGTVRCDPQSLAKLRMGTGSMILSGEAYRHLPGTLTLSSLDAGWRSVLLRGYAEPAEIAEMTTPPTADQLIVLIRKGTCEIESFSRGRWRQASYRPGDLGMTAPGETSRLRWRRAHDQETLHLHIPATTIRDVVGQMRTRTGNPLVLPNHLSSDDPVIVAVMTSLEQSLRQGSPDIYAEAAVQFLTVHLLSRYVGAQTQAGPKDAGSHLDRLDEYMRAQISEPVSLKDMSIVANRSVFQLIRMCKAHWGETPLSRLTHLRMKRARELLQHGDESIIEVALECGYGNPSHFATAFRRCVGTTPSQYRIDRQGQ